jgi:NADP-dependent 3-hydroxy acid dehydrogenase YdfG
MPSARFDTAGLDVLVTGATSGIGRATAVAFARSGAHVTATGRSAQALAALRDELRDAPVPPATLAGDITSPAFATTLAACAPGCDVLVNSAGLYRPAPFLESPPSDWTEVFEVNVLALLRVTQAVAKGMVVRGRGRIVNVTSNAARQVYPLTLAYSATKYAVRAISEGLRLELAPHGVCVTEVAPGRTETPMLGAATAAGAHPEAQRIYGAIDYPKLSADDVAGLIVFAATCDANACPQVLSINPRAQVTAT